MKSNSDEAPEEPRISEDSETRLNPKEEEKIKLSWKQEAEIEEKLVKAEQDIQNTLERTEINVKGVTISLITSMIFIVLCIQLNPVENVAEMARTIKGYYESQKFSEEPDKYFADVSNEAELDKYIRHIILPLFRTQQINNYNYLVGVRFSLKLAHLVENPFDEYSDAVRMVKKNPDMSPNKKNSGERTSDLGLWTYDEEGGFEGAGGYVQYFINMTQEEAFLTWRKMRAVWLDNQRFSSLAIETIFHNRNLETTLYYYQVFQRTSTGLLVPSTGTSGIFPEMFASTEFGISLATIGIIYLVGVVIQLIRLYQNLKRCCTTLWIRMKLEVAWHEILEFIMVALVFTSVLMFFFIAVARLDPNDEMLPLSNNRNGYDEFSGLINYAKDYRNFIRVTATSALLVAFKSILTLKNKAPSFGILFDTINEAKNDIINFGFIAMILLTAFALMGYLAFGNSTPGFSNLSESFLTLFDMILGTVDFQSMQEGNPNIAWIYFLVFMALFFFILLNMFLAIVLNHYSELRRLNQAVLEAKAALLKAEIKEIVRVIFNLIFCRVDTTIEKDSKRFIDLWNKRDKESNDKESNNKDRDELQKLRNSIVQQNKQNITDKLKFNFAQLLSFYKKDEGLMTKTVHTEKLKASIREIEEEKMRAKMQKEKWENDVDRNFTLILEMFLFIIFIIVFVWSVLITLGVEDSYFQFKTVSDVFTTPEFIYNSHRLQFAEIMNAAEVYKYTEDVIGEVTTKDRIAYFNYFVGDTRFRVTFNRAKIERNTRNFSDKVFSTYRTGNADFVSDSVYTGTVSGRNYNYESPGNVGTFKQKGGYVVNIGSSETSTVLSDLLDDHVLDGRGAEMAFEWVMYNPNKNLYTYSYITFANMISGQLVPEISSQALNLDIVEAENITLFVLYSLLTITYIVMEFREWLEVWTRLNNSRLEAEKRREQVKEALEIIENKQGEEATGLTFIALYVYKKFTSCVRWISSIIIQFFTSLLQFLNKDVFNIFDVVSLCLSISMIYYTIILFSYKFRIDFKIEENYQDYIGEFAYYSEIYNNYKLVAAFNSLIIFLRMQQFYKFSKHLSLLSSILDSAGLDIMLFMLMFAIILFAYALMGYMLLGHYAWGFSTVSKAVIGCYIMLLGEYNREEMSTADSVLGMFFFVSFMILFNFLLLNMFIAIIGAHFENLKPDPDKEYMGFFSKIMQVFKAKINKKTELYPTKDDDDDDDDFADHTKQAKGENFIDEEKDEYNPITNWNYAVAWIEELDNVLVKRTQGEITINGLKDQGLYELENIKPADEEDLFFLDKEMWYKLDHYEKLSFWKCMSKLHFKQIEKDEDQAKLRGVSFKASEFLTKFQMSLWEDLDFESKLQMWIGNPHLNYQERVAIWNSVVFSKHYFPSAKNINWTAEDQRNFWSSLNEEEKKQTAASLLKHVKRRMVKIRNKARRQNELDHDSIIKYLLKKFKNFNDERLILWVSLSYSEEAKLYMLLNQPLSEEADLITHLLFEEKSDNIFALDATDSTLTAMLDSQFFDKIAEQANFQAEAHRFRMFSDKLEDQEISLRNLEAFHDHLEIQNKELENEIWKKESMQRKNQDDEDEEGNRI